ncbi:hypothetical protein HCJ76_30785 [Streptomyces sp. MC1]|uniref:hypothetical protein n=1 Tax=Streptomyces sp. MC1 TaxID=295105 RepID=UPI0018CAAD6B|nr:hypothetical protein [Streptomyces sp. MC1]MBG7702354.1 hypothetical protein [Streptomyces sp. MC1]
MTAAITAGCVSAWTATVPPAHGEKTYAESRSAPASSPGQPGVRAGAQLTVLLGMEVLTVDYTAEPSSPERAHEVAEAVARTWLGGL